MRQIGPAMLRCNSETWALGALLALAATACGSAPECRVGADCASGVCLGDGTCFVPDVDGGPTPDTGMPGTDAGVDLGMPGSDAGTDSGSALCSPNHDGTIDRSEVPLAAGLHATFRVGTNATFDTRGTGSAGAYDWDLSGMLASDDHDERVDLLPTDGTWYAPTFPTATYAAKLSATSDNLGVFRIEDTQLLLLGVVSPMDGPTRTSLVYSPPVVVLRFPFHEGDTWSTTSNVTGQALGVFGTYTELYASVVDASGTLHTPFGDFPVLRVRTSLVRTEGVVPVLTTMSHAFVTECFGTVATITSQPGTTTTEFTSAAEIRRLAP